MIILTLNLHTYQESNQKSKFDEIIRAINFYNPDFICFQECAQHKNAHFIDNSEKIRVDNMAHIISNKLNSLNNHYYYYWEWAHYGWNVWEEGLAIFSKYPIIEQEIRYISKSDSKNDAQGSRIAIFTGVEHPDCNRLNIFCVHLSWLAAGLIDQIDNLDLFVNSKLCLNNADTIICGDFNETPTGEGYKKIINAGYIDTFGEINKRNFFEPTLKNCGRIDYIFLKNNRCSLKIIDSFIIFNKKNFSMVSDHYGLVTEFEVL